MIPSELQDVLVSDPEFEDGILLFKGTRVRLFDYIMADTVGITTEEFLAKYPEVQIEQVRVWNEWDRLQMEGKDPTDLQTYSHCWNLRIFPPMSSHDSRNIGFAK